MGGCKPASKRGRGRNSRAVAALPGRLRAHLYGTAPIRVASRRYHRCRAHIKGDVERQARRGLYGGPIENPQPTRLETHLRNHLLMAHMSPAYVQKQLGHHSISMTVDIYGHWIPGEGRERLDKALRPKAKPGNPFALVQGQE